MIDKNILIIDDDENFQDTLNKYLKNNGFTVSAASNGSQAITLFEKYRHPLVLTDLNMPVMDGKILIDYFNKLENKPMIIVISGNEDINTVIDIMKQGVYDYILKPLNFNELLVKLNKAYDILELMRTKNLLEKEKLIKLEKQVEFLQWRKRFINNEMRMDEKTLIENIYRSFNQGAGIGFLVSITEMILASAKFEDNKAIIDPSLLELLKQNTEISRKALSEFFDIININSEEIETENINYKEIYDIIKKSISKIESKLEIKKQTILLNDFNNKIECSLKINKNYFEALIIEMLLNAMKYSKEKSKIIILTEKSSNNLIFDFINEPENSDKDDAGIPFGYENLIFEPFFRVSKFVQENYETLEFGLGLTKVEIIVKKHNGKISVFNINDFSDKDFKPIKKIDFKITFPI